MPERFPRRSSSEIVVTACADRRWDDLQLAVLGLQVEDLFRRECRLVEAHLPTIGSSSAEALKGGLYPAQVLRASGGHDVEAPRRLLRPLKDAREPAHDDVSGALLVECSQKLVGIEL